MAAAHCENDDSLIAFREVWLTSTCPMLRLFGAVTLAQQCLPCTLTLCRAMHVASSMWTSSQGDNVDKEHGPATLHYCHDRLPGEACWLLYE